MNSRSLVWPSLILAAALTTLPARAQTTRITTDYIDANISLRFVGFEGLSLDSLGKERFPLIRMGPATVSPAVVATRRGSKVQYHRPDAPHSAPARWTIEIHNREIRLESRWTEQDPPAPLVLDADNSLCHVTLLGRLNADGAVQLPALMHFPDRGTLRISASGANALGYSTGPGDMGAHQAKAVRITFPAATRGHPEIRYRCQVVTVYPKLKEIDRSSRFDGFRRNWLNILQLSPHWRTLANHAASDTCAFCYYEYADIAQHTPPLAKGLSALDLVRQTLDRIIGGANAYGMPGHGGFPEYSADTLPSLLLAAGAYVTGTKDQKWLTANYGQLKAWADKMLSTDHTGDGLIEYTLSGDSGSWPERLKYRPANWWDTIGFGHEDAYANALAYRALGEMSQLAGQSGHAADQVRYRVAADRLRAAYFDAFYDPATGVLAGWRSADGQLHDYYFLWVNGIAIHYGLVPKAKANALMDHLLAKMKEVGYTRFDLGLPGNLVPIARKDYVDHNPRFGGGKREDNADGFQIYENGGATGCFAYFTLAALYDLGRIEEGDRILFPMLSSFARGGFQGRCSNGMSKDWKTWDGTCWGYEGFLSDNYYTMLALLDREAALEKRKSTTAER